MMTLPRIPAAAVAAGQALDRADTTSELEAAWLLNDCDAFRGAALLYLSHIRGRVQERHDRAATALRLVRAI